MLQRFEGSQNTVGTGIDINRGYVAPADYPFGVDYVRDYSLKGINLPLDHVDGCVQDFGYNPSEFPQCVFLCYTRLRGLRLP